MSFTFSSPVIRRSGGSASFARASARRPTRLTLDFRSAHSNQLAGNLLFVSAIAKSKHEPQGDSAAPRGRQPLARIGLTGMSRRRRRLWWPPLASARVISGELISRRPAVHPLDPRRPSCSSVGGGRRTRFLNSLVSGGLCAARPPKRALAGRRLTASRRKLDWPRSLESALPTGKQFELSLLLLALLLLLVASSCQRASSSGHCERFASAKSQSDHRALGGDSPSGRAAGRPATCCRARGRDQAKSERVCVRMT
jgi:hypothetical protein